MKLIKEIYLNILLEEIELQRYDNDYFTINDDILNEEILEKSFQNIVIESDDPNYFVKMPNSLIELTKNSNNSKDIRIKFLPNFKNAIWGLVNII